MPMLLEHADGWHGNEQMLQRRARAGRQSLIYSAGGTKLILLIDHPRTHCCRIGVLLPAGHHYACTRPGVRLCGAHACMVACGLLWCVHGCLVACFNACMCTYVVHNLQTPRRQHFILLSRAGFGVLQVSMLLQYPVTLPHIREAVPRLAWRHAVIDTRGIFTTVAFTIVFTVNTLLVTEDHFALQSQHTVTVSCASSDRQPVRPRGTSQLRLPYHLADHLCGVLCHRYTTSAAELGEGGAAKRGF
eukprot:364410-Chlamydomonas_euryale.AAC.16